LSIFCFAIHYHDADNRFKAEIDANGSISNSDKNRNENRSGQVQLGSYELTEIVISVEISNRISKFKNEK